MKNPDELDEVFSKVQRRLKDKEKIDHTWSIFEKVAAWKMRIQEKYNSTFWPLTPFTSCEDYAKFYCTCCGKISKKRIRKLLEPNYNTPCHHCRSLELPHNDVKPKIYIIYIGYFHKDGHELEIICFKAGATDNIKRRIKELSAFGYTFKVTAQYQFYGTWSQLLKCERKLLNYNKKHNKIFTQLEMYVGGRTECFVHDIMFPEGFLEECALSQRKTFNHMFQIAC